MPLYEFRCTGCRCVFQRLAPTALAAFERGPCCTASDGSGYFIERVGTGPSAQVVERLDNGAMAKPVERYADAERLYRERSDGADALAGGAQRTDKG